jgi:hypothetical protein
MRTETQEKNDDGDLERVETRLREALDEFWQRFVDPDDAMYDDEGMRWGMLGPGADRPGGIGGPFANESQLHDIRSQCRALAVTNEFAINGHENRMTKALLGHGSGARRVRTAYSACRRVPTTALPAPPSP